MCVGIACLCVNDALAKTLTVNYSPLQIQFLRNAIALPFTILIAWKMGGGAAQLDQNMEECTAALGEAHKPNKATFTFTRGFAICMREKGWRGLISQNKEKNNR